MKINSISKIIILLIYSICNLISAQKLENSENSSSFDYVKLKEPEIQRLFKLETKKHYLGAVTYYTYLEDNKLTKSTTYENRKGQLVFEYERGEQHDLKDRLLYEYQYSELPTYEYPELKESKYIYPSDSVTIEIQTLGKDQIDSTFTISKRNNLNLLIKLTETSTTTYEGRTGIGETKMTTCSYGKNAELLQKVTIDLKYGDTLTTQYNYINNQLATENYKDKRMQRVQTYKNALLISSEEKILDRASKTIYTYNSKNQETLSQNFENKKLVYSYKTFYNAAGLKTKYEMQDEVDRENVSYWLYEYDENGRLAYHINLYKRMTRSAAPAPVYEVRPK